MLARLGLAQPENWPVAKPFGRRAVLEDQPAYGDRPRRVVSLSRGVVGRPLLDRYPARRVGAQVACPIGRVSRGGDEQRTIGLLGEADWRDDGPAAAAATRLEQRDLAPAGQLLAERRLVYYRDAPRCQDLPSPVIAGA